MSDIDNDLAEAVCMLKSVTRQKPEMRHLRALSESRVYWREAAMTSPRPVVPVSPKREVMVNRINAFFNWLERLSDVQHAVFVVFIALLFFAGASACLAGMLQGVKVAVRTVLP